MSDPNEISEPNPISSYVVGDRVIRTTARPSMKGARNAIEPGTAGVVTAVTANGAILVRWDGWREASHTSRYAPSDADKISPEPKAPPAPRALTEGEQAVLNATRERLEQAFDRSAAKIVPFSPHSSPPAFRIGQQLIRNDDGYPLTIVEHTGTGSWRVRYAHGSTVLLSEDYLLTNYRSAPTSLQHGDRVRHVSSGALGTVSIYNSGRGPITKVQWDGDAGLTAFEGTASASIARVDHDFRLGELLLQRGPTGILGTLERDNGSLLELRTYHGLRSVAKEAVARFVAPPPPPPPPLLAWRPHPVSPGFEWRPGPNGTNEVRLNAAPPRFKRGDRVRRALPVLSDVWVVSHVEADGRVHTILGESIDPTLLEIVSFTADLPKMLNGISVGDLAYTKTLELILVTEIGGALATHPWVAGFSIGPRKCLHRVADLVPLTADDKGQLLKFEILVRRAMGFTKPTAFELEVIRSIVENSIDGSKLLRVDESGIHILLSESVDPQDALRQLRNKVWLSDTDAQSVHFTSQREVLRASLRAVVEQQVVANAQAQAAAFNSDTSDTINHTRTDQETPMADPKNPVIPIPTTKQIFAEQGKEAASAILDGLSEAAVEEVGDVLLDLAKDLVGDSGEERVILDFLLSSPRGRELVKALTAVGVNTLVSHAPTMGVAIPKANIIRKMTLLQYRSSSRRLGAPLMGKGLRALARLADIGEKIPMLTPNAETPEEVPREMVAEPVATPARGR